MRRISVILLGLLIGSPIFAARPFNTDDPGTVENKIIEFETGLNVNEGGSEGYVSLKTGISERADFGMAFGVIPEIQGIECGTKLSLYNTSSFQSALSLGWEPGDKDFNVNLIGAFSFPIFEILMNIGLPSSVDNISGGILIGKPVMNDKIYIGAEVNPEYNRDNGDFNLSAQVGGSYNIIENLSVDAGIGIQNKAWQFTTGLIYDF